MTTTATATHRVTIPKKMSEFIARKAKSENTTFSQAAVNMIEEELIRQKIWKDIRKTGKGAE